MGIFKKKKDENSIETVQKETIQKEPVQKKPAKKEPKHSEKVEYREYDAISDRRKAERRQSVRRTIVALFFAFLFLTPTVLTFTNSFMTASEINANYGSIFAQNTSGGKVFVSEVVNLKFIPDMVTFSQYATVLFKSPEYLMKFWNSVIGFVLTTKILRLWWFQAPLIQ